MRSKKTIFTSVLFIHTLFIVMMVMNLEYDWRVFFLGAISLLYSIIALLVALIVTIITVKDLIKNLFDKFDLLNIVFLIISVYMAVYLLKAWYNLIPAM